MHFYHTIYIQYTSLLVLPTSNVYSRRVKRITMQAITSSSKGRVLLNKKIYIRDQNVLKMSCASLK